MRRIYYCVLLAAAFANPVTAQQFNYLFLKPDATNGKDAILGWHSPDDNHGTNSSMHVTAWTYNGQPTITRGLIAFDLNSIPPGSIIGKAILKLHYNPNTGFNNNIQEGDNHLSVHRVTQPWDESTVTWNTQPAFTTTGSLSVPATSSFDEPLTLDITALLQISVDSPSVSHGFLLKLNGETAFANRLFASSDHEECTLHPELFVVFSDVLIGMETPQEDAIVQIYPNPAEGFIHLETNFNGGAPGKFQIADMHGRVLKTFEVARKKELMDISDLHSGTYVVYLFEGTSNKLLTRKLLKL